MTGIVSLAAVRQEREPDPDCVHELPDGQHLFLYVAVYQHDDEDHEVHLWATDMVDAQRQVLSMSRTLSVVGQLMRTGE